MSLSFVERRKTILELLDKEDKVHVSKLAKELNVSDETIRRDLDRLEKEGKLKKVYGGAVKERSKIWEQPFEKRSFEKRNEKRALCKKAAELVMDGDIIMIGYGSTTLELIDFIRDKKDLTVITASVPVLISAMEKINGRIIFIGGEVNKNQQSCVGPLTERILERLKVNKVFLSASGLSIYDGLTDHELDGANVSRKMIERGEETIVLSDHTKFGKTTFAFIAPINSVSAIVTDSNCPDEWKTYLSEQGIELFIAEQEKNE